MSDDEIVLGELEIPLEPVKRKRGRPRKNPVPEELRIPEAKTTREQKAKERKSSQSGEVREMQKELKKLYRNDYVMQAYKKVDLDIEKLDRQELEDRLEQARETQKEYISKHFDSKITEEIVETFHNQITRRIVDVDIAEDLKKDKLFMEGVQESLWVLSYLPGPLKVGVLYGLHIVAGIKDKLFTRRSQPDVQPDVQPQIEPNQ